MTPLWFWEIPVDGDWIKAEKWHHLAVAPDRRGRIRVYLDGTRYVKARRRKSARQ